MNHRLLHPTAWVKWSDWPKWLGVCALALLMAPAFAQPKGVLVFEGKDGWVFPGWENLQQHNAPAMREGVALIREAERLFHHAKIQLVVVVIPTKGVLHASHLPDSVSVSPEVKNRYADIQAEFKRVGVVSVDLYPAFAKLHSQGKQTYYKTDYHWTAFGSEAAAAAVADTVSQLNVIPPNPNAAPVPLGEWVHERHFGDLVSKFMSPVRRDELGRERFTVRLPPPASSGLLDEDSPAIHVMGNSFVQPYWGFSQAISAQLKVPSSLTWNAGSVGQWAIAVMHAEAQLKGLTKPKVIVWQMNEAQVQIGPDVGGMWDIKGLMSPDAWKQRLAEALK